MTQNPQGHGPHPDPPVDENLDIVEGETDPQASGQGPHPDPVDEASEESFPNSDPPATWAGPDDA